MMAGVTAASPTDVTETDGLPFADWAPSQIRHAAEALYDRVRTHRRELHRNPELALEEHRTAAYIEGVLAEVGIPTRRLVGTGVVAVVPGGSGKVVGVRADMDALPVPEASGRDGYRSRIDGVSHACGHDAHVAIALGLAELLAGAPDLPGPVAFYFQPAEESHGGAAPMVGAGALADPVPDAVLALHVAPQYPVGTIGIRPGPVVASFDTVKMRVRGVGGHAAHPYGAIDPIPIAASIIMATQHMMTREVNPMHPAIITYGSIHGGTRPNVIPQDVLLEATVRAIRPETRKQLLSRLTELAQGIAGSHRASVAIEILSGYPAGSNDDHLAAVVRNAGHMVLGPQHVTDEPFPSLGSEDFFAFGDEGARVCMFRLGVSNVEAGIDAPLHSPGFDLDENAMTVGMSVLAESIRRIATA